MRYLLTPLFILWFLFFPSLGFTQELSCPKLSNVVVSSSDKDGIVEICLALKST